MQRFERMKALSDGSASNSENSQFSIPRPFRQSNNENIPDESQTQWPVVNQTLKSLVSIQSQTGSKIGANSQSTSQIRERFDDSSQNSQSQGQMMLINPPHPSQNTNTRYKRV